MGFLRDIFGPSKDEIWQQVANEIGGQFENGGIFGKDALRFQSGQWELTLDTYTVSHGDSRSTYTRMRAPFVNQDNIRFKIYEEGIFAAIGKVFGMKDIEIGHSFFDKKFIVKSNSEDKIKKLLQDKKLKQLINYQNDILFSVRGDDGWFGKSFPEGVDELYFECAWVMKDLEDIKKLFELFTHTLELLVELDSAYAANSRIKLS
tara:strand:- start:6421 stop:7035 length:615 start_codon:yes stop_codon:yes gene_type:complete